MLDARSAIGGLAFRLLKSFFHRFLFSFNQVTTLGPTNHLQVTNQGPTNRIKVMTLGILNHLKFNHTSGHTNINQVFS